MVRLVQENTNFVTGNISDALAAVYKEYCPTNGGHGKSLGLKACGVAKFPLSISPIRPVIVDSSPEEKAIIVDEMNVEPHSSLADRRWKLRYMDGDVLSIHEWTSTWNCVAKLEAYNV